MTSLTMCEIYSGARSRPQTWVKYLMARARVMNTGIEADFFIHKFDFIVPSSPHLSLKP